MELLDGACTGPWHHHGSNTDRVGGTNHVLVAEGGRQPAATRQVRRRDRIRDAHVQKTASHRMRTVACLSYALVCMLAAASKASAQNANEFVIDARQTPPAIESGFLRLGAVRSPSGHTLGATSRYLTRD